MHASLRLSTHNAPQEQLDRLEQLRSTLADCDIAGSETIGEEVRAFVRACEWRLDERLLDQCEWTSTTVHDEWHVPSTYAAVGLPNAAHHAAILSALGQVQAALPPGSVPLTAPTRQSRYIGNIPDPGYEELVERMRQATTAIGSAQVTNTLPPVGTPRRAPAWLHFADQPGDVDLDRAHASIASSRIGASRTQQQRAKKRDRPTDEAKQPSPARARTGAEPTKPTAIAVDDDDDIEMFSQAPPPQPTRTKEATRSEQQRELHRALRDVIAYSSSSSSSSSAASSRTSSTSPSRRSSFDQTANLLQLVDAWQSMPTAFPDYVDDDPEADELTLSQFAAAAPQGDEPASIVAAAANRSISPEFESGPQPQEQTSDATSALDVAAAGASRPASWSPLIEPTVATSSDVLPAELRTKYESLRGTLVAKLSNAGVVSAIEQTCNKLAQSSTPITSSSALAAFLAHAKLKPLSSWMRLFFQSIQSWRDLVSTKQFDALLVQPLDLSSLSLNTATFLLLAFLSTDCSGLRVRSVLAQALLPKIKEFGTLPTPPPMLMYALAIIARSHDASLVSAVLVPWLVGLRTPPASSATAAANPAPDAALLSAYPTLQPLLLATSNVRLSPSALFTLVHHFCALLLHLAHSAAMTSTTNKKPFAWRTHADLLNKLDSQLPALRLPTPTPVNLALLVEKWVGSSSSHNNVDWLPPFLARCEPTTAGGGQQGDCTSLLLACLILVQRPDDGLAAHRARFVQTYRKTYAHTHAQELASQASMLDRLLDSIAGANPASAAS